MVSTLFLNTIPYLNGKFIDYLLIATNESNIIYFVLVAVAIISIGLIIGYFGNLIWIKLQSQITFELYKKIFIHINRLPISKINQFNATALNQRISVDTSTVISFYLNTMQNLLIQTTILVVYCFIIARINSYYLLLVIMFAAIYFFSNKFMRKKIYNSDFEMKEVQSYFFSKTQEQFNSIKFIKTHGLNGIFENRLDYPFREFLKSSIKKQKINYFFSGMDNYFNLIIQIVMIFIGGTSIIRDKMTIGEFTILNSYITMAMNVIRYYYNLGKSVQTSLTSLDRLNEILDIEIESNGSIQERNIKYVQLKNISIQFDNKVIIKNFSYMFEKGKIYALTGHNGAGKTTLLYTILGMYNDCIKGNVTINNIPIEKLDMINVRKNLIGYVEQSPIIFSGTIKDNISLFHLNGIGGYQTFELEKEFDLGSAILKEKEFIDNGDLLSGGEKLKISLIRTLSKAPSLILLDEPTSMLDKKSINVLIKVLQKIKRERIIIIVTHDLKLIDIVDNVIEL